MTYEKIVVLVSEDLYKVNVQFKDIDNVVVLNAETLVGTSDSLVAENYAEEIFIPDLIRNFPKKLAELIPQPEQPEEPIV
jgi:hypothetical protein